MQVDKQFEKNISKIVIFICRRNSCILVLVSLSRKTLLRQFHISQVIEQFSNSFPL